MISSIFLAFFCQLYKMVGNYKILWMYKDEGFDKNIKLESKADHKFLVLSPI